MDVVIGYIILAGVLMLYVLPAYIAQKRRHRNQGAICVLNVLLGWTFLGWVLAMVWAATDNVQSERA